MHAVAEDASALLRALGNRHRLLILCQLIDGERSVGQLAELLAIRDSTVSQHLSLLRREGIVTGRRDSQTIWYSMISAPARNVVAALYTSFCAQRDRKPPRRRVQSRDPSRTRRNAVSKDKKT